MLELEREREECPNRKPACPSAIATPWIPRRTGSTWWRRDRQTNSRAPFTEMRNGEGGSLELTATERAARTCWSTGSPTPSDRAASSTTATGRPHPNRRNAPGTHSGAQEASERAVRDGERGRIPNLQGLQPVLCGLDQVQRQKRKIVSLQAEVHELLIWRQTSLRRQRQERGSRHLACRRVYREASGTA